MTDVEELKAEVVALHKNGEIASSSPWATAREKIDVMQMLQDDVIFAEAKGDGAGARKIMEVIAALLAKGEAMSLRQTL